MVTTTLDPVAPILLFAFARPEHTRQTLHALSLNHLAARSDVIVFADAARKPTDEEAVAKVRKTVKSARGFRSVTLVERETNYGLARNIIEGVTEVCEQHSRVIVLEDDLITSPHFLTYMNSALARYSSENKVWHISGWNYPVDPQGLRDAFFTRVMNCWGWATWADRWKHFEKDTERLISEFDRAMIRRFDLGGSGVFWSQVLNNRKGVINTWAIFWYATIFRHDGLCLNPAMTYVDNIGLDGSGTHGSQARPQYTCAFNQSPCVTWPEIIAESDIAMARIVDFYDAIRPTLAERILGRIGSLRARIF